MPLQRFDRAPEPAFSREEGGGDWQRGAARAFLFAVTLLLTGYGLWQMLAIVGYGEATFMQGVLVFLFTGTFGWIAFGAANAVLGFLVIAARRLSARPLPRQPLPRGRRTAIVMPVYNENPDTVFGALARMGAEMGRSPLRGDVEIFVLSDTSDPALAARERERAGSLARRMAGTMPVYYRRRDDNAGRKAGNIADFVRRWGGRYDYMIVLDADSYLTSDAVTSLIAAMDADPRAGLIQASIRLAGRETLFARVQQFCHATYGAVACAGTSLWHGCDGNFNGHNAIIRVDAFASTCGLPDLPGRKPFGGHILSHDFVEAALLRRAGWDVYMRPDINGTYEESPPNLVEFAKRDRRWTQGNLQHARLLSSAGFHWMSRLHLVCGILAYLSSVLWFLFLITGVSIAVHATLVPREYFPEIHSLFPEWPVFDAGLALQLTGFSLSVLLLPKVLGFLAAIADPAMRAGAGGGAALTLSVAVETLLSALLAPVFMIIQTTHVTEILLARDSGWPQQRRDDGALAVAEVTRRLWLSTIAGVTLAVGSYYLSPGLFFWLAPIWAGLTLAIPLAVVTSSHALGVRARESGLFLIEEEVAPRRQPPGPAQQDAPERLAA